jgi:metacaspase-1
MKILLVHGVGHSEATPNYYGPWKQAIAAGLHSAGLPEEPDFLEFTYDTVFEKHYSGPGVYATAVAELLATAAWDGITGLFRPSREYLGDTVRWHAGMVAQFAIEDGLRRELRNALFTALTDPENRPDVVAAHSLGSLLTFDFFHNDDRAAEITDGNRVTYLTFGSQINNVFIRSRVWPGRLAMPAAVRSWIHLYNPEDHVFTADIAIPDEPDFRSVRTPSDAGHSPVTTPEGPGYLDHPETIATVWPLLVPRVAVRSLGVTMATDVLQRRRKTRPIISVAKPRRRALLIGINDYPDPANRLEGCVNDTFLFSSALQEIGFEAEDIRVVLNERATAAGIRERLKWLLEDVGDGMERVLFYSGHGAQLPGYNGAETVDHVDECLVPYDFNWEKETAITDDDFYHLYSDLPFSARFFAVFDCCHSGGLTREGGSKIRGITPPDDIRHRLLRWNAKEQMWEERKLPAINDHYGDTAERRRALMGNNGATVRLGRGMNLRRHMTKATADKLVKEHCGLYLPVLLEACGEEQLSYEYRHGTVSYGAFTYALIKNLRAKPTVSFEQLIARTGASLTTLGYDQTPQIVGPSAVVTKPIVTA